MRLLLCLLMTLSAAVAHATETNFLTFGAGAVVVRASVAAEGVAHVAIDGSARTRPIGIPKREPLPLTIVIELPSPTTFDHFQVPPPDEFGSNKGRHVSTLRIEGSATSADEGFSLMAEAAIVQGQPDPQRFAVTEPRPVRWVRVTFVDRHAPPRAPHDPHNFSELEGYGRQDPIAARADAFNGRWRYRRKGINDAPGLNIIELTQKGQDIQGCQRMGGKQTTISGTIVDGLARLIAEDEKGKHTPLTAIVLSDGQLAGVEFEGPPSAFYAAPDAGAEAPCKAPPPDNPVTEALGDGQTATLWGIHFDVDSDVLRADAKSALEQLLEALTALPAATVTIEGHTDSDGSDAHNQDLSERRAKAVVAWLVARGIDAARLAPIGKGEAAPIADNDTSAGRALNRRVEVEPRKAPAPK